MLTQLPWTHYMHRNWRVFLDGRTWSVQVKVLEPNACACKRLKWGSWNKQVTRLQNWSYCLCKWQRRTSSALSSASKAQRLKLLVTRNSYWLMGKKEMIRLPDVPFDSGRNQREITNPNRNKCAVFTLCWMSWKCGYYLTYFNTPLILHRGQQKCNNKDGFNSCEFPMN